MRIHDAEATRAALPFDRLIAALRALLAAGCTVPPRHVHAVGAAFTSLIMPAWIEGRHYGVKVVNAAPANRAAGLPGLHAAYLLFDGSSGVPLALIDGDQITARRTAATSALAASSLARADARHLLVVGAGRVAALLPEAYREVLPIERVTVWARSADAAAALAASWRARGFDAAAGADLAAAAGAADVVACATPATEPLIAGRWLRAGSHLDLIGSYAPAMREADDDAFAGASVWVDTDEALHKSGELIGPLARGVVDAAAVGTLAALVRGGAPGRRSAAERTVFKSVGSALQDLAAALLVHQGSRPANAARLD